MSLRPSELELVVEELAENLSGAFVQKLHASAGPVVFLEVRHPGRSTLICLSAEPSVGRVSVTEDRPPSAPVPFQQRLRKELLGARLEGVAVRGPTTLALELTRRGERRALIGELTEGHLLLLDGEEKVLAQLGRGGPRFRAGERYSPPPFSGPADAPSRLVTLDGWLGHARAAELLLHAPDQRRRAEAIRRQLVGPLRAKVTRTARTLEKVRAEAARTDAAIEHRRLGELLVQNAHRIAKGAKSVTLTEYGDEGPREVVVPIDPRRTPKEEADWHFHQYRRLTRGMEHAKRRLEELELEAEETRRALAEVERLSEKELLEQLPPPPKPKGPPRAKPYREYQSADGARILVGKGAEGNDALTFRVARPHDLWLHALGVPGSHVVLPLERGAVPGQQALIDAAHLALHASQAKGEERGEVAYTQAKYVRKVKGGGPGQVTYTREKVMAVRIDPERLRRLLRSAEGPS